MKMSFDELSSERKRQLARISDIRERDIVVFASDLGKDCPNSIEFSDIVPFTDQLSQAKGNKIDIILETPGGLAEVVEDLVRQIRLKFEMVGIIVPGTAKSAGTIFAMAADEILMSSTSSLGPIDAQIISNGKRYSADAFLEGLKKIQEETTASRKLDITYIPILQNISPGEIQHCENAQNFSKTLVTNWLKEYKFKFWETHNSTGDAVTAEEKVNRANEIASLLCNHSHWLTHGRSIKLPDLEEMKLKITDYSTNSELNDAISRYYTLLRMSFETNIYKIYETPISQIYRSINNTGSKQNLQQVKSPVLLDFQCPKCHNIQKLQINLIKSSHPIQNTVLFPSDNKYKCPKCGIECDLAGLRLKLEAELGKIVD